MANPAELLHTLLTSWTIGFRQGPVADRRGVRASEPDLTEHFVAVRLLSNLNELLTAREAEGKKVTAYRAMLQRLNPFVFVFPFGWGGLDQTVGQVPNENDLVLLDLWAEQLQDEVPTFKPDGRRDLAEIVKDARKALAEDETLPLSLRRHLHGLLAEVDFCLSAYDTLGDFELSKAVARLNTTLRLAEETSKKPGVWKRMAEAVATQVIAGLILLGVNQGPAALMPGESSPAQIEAPPAPDEIIDGEVVEDDQNPAV